MPGALGPEKELPNPSAADASLFADQENIALRNKEHFIDIPRYPFEAGRRILIELNGNLCASWNLNQRAVILLTEYKLRYC